MYSRTCIQQRNGGFVKTKEERSTERTKDLATRERVNFVISSDVMIKLREKSDEVGIPMSRIVDTALIEYLRQPPEHALVRKSEKGIDLFHRFEIVVYKAHSSPFTQNFLNLVAKYLQHITSTSCLLKTPEKDGESLIGTKIFSFVADSQQENLSNLLNETILLENRDHIEVLLDSQLLHL